MCCLVTTYGYWMVMMVRAEAIMARSKPGKEGVVGVGMN